MANIRDVEDLMRSLVTVMQAGLPAKITAINAQKADGIVLEQIANANYYNVINEQVEGVSPFIYYGFSSIGSESIGSNKTKLTPTIFFEVAFSNDYRDQDAYWKVLRYTRAMQEVMQDNFFRIRSSENLRIEPFTPADIHKNDGADLKIGGIQVTTTMVT